MLNILRKWTLFVFNSLLFQHAWSSFMNTFTRQCLDEFFNDAVMLQCLQKVRFLICFLNSLRLNESNVLWPSPLPWQLPWHCHDQVSRSRNSFSEDVVNLMFGLGNDRNELLNGYWLTHLITFRQSFACLCVGGWSRSKMTSNLELRLEAMKRSRLVFYGPILFQQRSRTRRPEDRRAAQHNIT
jgi:hypothetical protein